MPIYTNWLAKDKVLAKVDQFSKKAKKDFVIAVYPSWKLYKSGTLLIEPKRIIIEACKGHVAELMREGNCQLRLIYSSDKKLKESSGDGKFLNSNERQKILKSTNKISRKNIILEWAIGQEKEFIFYKLEDLKEAGKKLLEKYS